MSDDIGVASWTHTTAEIPPPGLEVAREASAQELALLASGLDILGLERFKVTYKIAPRTRGRYRLTGRLEARVVQACIVTLDPVVTDITDKFDVEFRPQGDVPVEPSAAEQEIGALAAEEYEVIEQHRLAVGQVLVETLAAALPPFPRAPGAELESHEAGPAEGMQSNPFAVLADWKDKTK